MTHLDSSIPEHTVEEKDDEVVITIVAPLSNPKEVAFVLEKTWFTFDSSPYFLKIKFSHPVSCKSKKQSFNNESGTYKIKLRKISDKTNSSSDEEEDTNEYFPDFEGENPPSDGGINKVKQFYGFCNKFSNMFGDLYREFSEVVNLPDPDHTPVSERKKFRIEEENEKWSDDHYLADTMETDHLESIFEYIPAWTNKNAKVNLNDDEKEILGCKNFFKYQKLSEENRTLSELQIVDILFSYAYNKRTTEGDNSVVSGWTINKLSSTLSWFEVFDDLKSVLLACYRRSLIYPLYRNWKLTKMIHKDVSDIMKRGFIQVTRCLLEVKEIFSENENQYLLNTLYLNDLSCFSYITSNERFMELAEELEKIKITKYEVNNELPILEIAAHIAMEEEESHKNVENVNNIVEKISKLSMKKEEVSSSESSSISSSESDTDESDSSPDD